MSEASENPEYLDAKARVRKGGEEFIKGAFVGMLPEGIQWLADATREVEQGARDQEQGGDIGAKAISEFLVLLKSTEQSILTGVSIDGDPVVPPPLSVSALRAILEFYIGKDGNSNQAWDNFIKAVRIGHMAQQMRGKIPASAYQPALGKTSGSGCVLLFLAVGLGIISLGVHIGSLIFA